MQCSDQGDLRAHRCRLVSPNFESREEASEWWERLADRTVPGLRSRLARLDADSDREALLAAYHLLDAHAGAIKQLRADLEEIFVAWIRAHGDLDDGQARWYLGRDTEKVITDRAELVHRCLEAALERAGGDLQGACATLADEALASSWCRLGGTRSLIGDAAFAELVREVEGEGLKEAKTKLKKIDERTERMLRQQREVREARAAAAVAAATDAP